MTDILRKDMGSFSLRILAVVALPFGYCYLLGKLWFEACEELDKRKRPASPSEKGKS